MRTAVRPHLLLAGSNAMAPLLQALSRKYQELHSDVGVEVQGGGSAPGLARLRAGEADIAMVSRALTVEERDLYGIPIARDAIALVVPASSPVPQLGDEQLAALCTGQLQNWSVLGGPDAAIHLLGATAGGGCCAVLARYLKVPVHALRLHCAPDTGAERLQKLAADPHAIAFAPAGFAGRAAAAGAPIRLLPVGGCVPTEATVKAGAYPLARGLTLASKMPPGDRVRSFLAFCLSAQVAPVLGDFDFVPFLD